MAKQGLPQPGLGGGSWESGRSWTPSQQQQQQQMPQGAGYQPYGNQASAAVASSPWPALRQQQQPYGNQESAAVASSPWPAPQQQQQQQQLPQVMGNQPYGNQESAAAAGGRLPAPKAAYPSSSQYLSPEAARADPVARMAFEHMLRMRRLNDNPNEYKGNAATGTIQDNPYWQKELQDRGVPFRADVMGGAFSGGPMANSLSPPYQRSMPHNMLHSEPILAHGMTSRFMRNGEDRIAKELPIPDELSRIAPRGPSATKWVDSMYQFMRDPKPYKQMFEGLGKTMNTLSERPFCNSANGGCSPFMSDFLPEGSQQWHMLQNPNPQNVVQNYNGGRYTGEESQLQREHITKGWGELQPTPNMKNVYNPWARGQWRNKGW